MNSREFSIKKSSQQWSACTTLTMEEVNKIPLLAKRFAECADALKWESPETLAITAFVTVSKRVGSPSPDGGSATWSAASETFAEFEIYINHPGGRQWIYWVRGHGARGKGAFQKVFDSLYFELWEESPLLKDWLPLELLSKEAHDKRRSRVREACLGLLGKAPEVFIPPRAIVMSQRQVEELANVSEEEKNGNN